MTDHSPIPKLVNSIVDTIGNTPLVRMNKVLSHTPGQFFGKMETFNPGRSSKDRIGVSIINDAEEKGLLSPGGMIVEATSGNTGLGLALVAIERGYQVTLVMPDKMSENKINLVKAIGCEVVVCPTEVEPDDPRSYYSVSKRLAEETGGFLANQYFNPANPRAHYQTTGPEIWEQSEMKVTHFFAGVGTGGTISGVGKYLKEKNPDVKIIGIDPRGSILAHYHKHRNLDTQAKSYKVEGVGEDIIPSTVNFDVIDDFVTVTDEESFLWTRKLAKEEGFMVGGSSGLVAAGVNKYFETNDAAIDTFAVLLFPDTGERYLGRVFSDSWLRSYGFLPPAESIKDILIAKPANIPPIISVTTDTPLSVALEKIRKFNINQIIVSDDHTSGKLLTRTTLYDALLHGKTKELYVKEIDLDEIFYLDINASLTELMYQILHGEVVIIRDKEVWVGLLTKQDIIDNMHLEDISSKQDD